MEKCLIFSILLILFSNLGEAKLINLQTELEPAKIRDFARQINTNQLIVDLARDNEYKLPANSDRKPVGTKTTVVGSNLMVYKDHRYDKGFFSTIYKAYRNHWVLKTTPEDWWFTIIRNVALDIDNHADNQKIKDFFVSHDGKKELVVDMGRSVYTTNYTSFLDQMASKIAENLNDPDYVKAMSSDFETSTPTHKIVANIALMSSVQNYFAYTGSILCGIPKVDMQGSEEDWRKLQTKVGILKEYLQDIINDIDQAHWWPKLEKITQSLLETYQGNPDKDWWGGIVTKPRNVGCGGPVTFDGWFVEDFLNEQPDNLPSGLISVPMKIIGKGDEQSALVAGIPGYKIEEEYNQFNDTMIQAVHAWALMLEENSVYRDDLIERDSNNEIY